MPVHSRLDRKSKRIQLYLTPQMWADLVHLVPAETPRHMAEEIRKAIQYYLKNEPRITGSRKYFTKNFRDHLDKLAAAQAEERAVLLALVSAAVYTISLAAYEVVFSTDPDRDWPGDREDQFVMEMLRQGLEIASNSDNVDFLTRYTQALRDQYRSRLDKEES